MTSRDPNRRPHKKVRRELQGYRYPAPVPQAEKFSAHLPAVLGATTATVGASLGTSYLGWAGTLTGLIAASLLTGGGAWWVERWYRRWAAKTRALAEARKRKGRPLSPDETSFIAAVSDEREKRADRAAGIPWRLAGMSAGVVLLATAAVILFIELGTGKPVSAVVQGKPAHGLLAPVGPSSEPSPSPSPTTGPASTPPVVASPSASLTPSLSPSPSPSVSPGSPTAPASATATTAPPGTSPAPVPTPDISGGTP